MTNDYSKIRKKYKHYSKRKKNASPEYFTTIVTRNTPYKRKVLDLVGKVAPTDTTVLISGESGTGKELLARSIFEQSLRNNAPYVTVNCACLHSRLVESELFGHKKGAFTGAIHDKIGKFMLANGGTIFLDEIGELPVEIQAKLLRVIQEKELEMLGDIKSTNIDVRIIAATNRDLEEMVINQLFREDLYYRLNVFPIFNIPLRERREDIPLLAQSFLEKYSFSYGKRCKKLSEQSIKLLMNYDYPGNIRELENIIHRGVILEQEEVMQPGDWIPNYASN